MHAKSVASALEKLVAFTSTTEWKDIPVPVQKRASLVLSDDIGAMVAARDEPELQSLQKGVAASAGKPEATLFNGKGQKIDRYSAALANGCASDWAE
ncbi:MAG: MmgE/PrpD family protein, partial [Alphaproteobacteria bacterium]